MSIRDIIAANKTWMATEPEDPEGEGRCPLVHYCLWGLSGSPGSMLPLPWALLCLALLAGVRSSSTISPGSSLQSLVGMGQSLFLQSALTHEVVQRGARSNGTSVMCVHLVPVCSGLRRGFAREIAISTFSRDGR